MGEGKGEGEGRGKGKGGKEWGGEFCAVIIFS